MLTVIIKPVSGFCPSDPEIRLLTGLGLLLGISDQFTSNSDDQIPLQGSAAEMQAGSVAVHSSKTCHHNHCFVSNLWLLHALFFNCSHILFGVC